MVPPDKVRASCHTCGTVDLLRPDVRLVLSDVPSACRYSFTCPKCRAWISKPADECVIALLLGKVPLHRETAPAELTEPHTGPPLTLDDLIDLHAEMAETDELARFAHR